VATWEDVQRIAAALPEVVVGGGDTRGWSVGDKILAWERPLGKRDLSALGLASQEEPVLCVRTADQGVKQALIEDDPEVFFATPHFNGYPAVLVWLDRISVDLLTELISEAWFARAPKRLVREHLARGTSPTA
jgi:hypothetical protein